ncbi:MAG: hypothetical protein QNK04_23820 [Myxococcota bacterium]|nr:hypothetical protein [Myxococcota bacterium]
MSAWAVLLFAASVGPAVPPPVAVQLSEKLELSAGELERARREVVVKELQAEADARQLSVAAITWVANPPKTLTRSLWDARGVPANGSLLQAGVFSSPPVAEDLSTFRLPDSDLSVLSSCRVASCKLKIDETAIAAFRALDWSSPRASLQAQDVARQTLLRYASTYQRSGSRALPAVADKAKPGSLAQGFAGLLANADRLQRYVSALDRHLKDFPGSELPHARDLLHWSVHDYGYRPVTQVTHAVLYEPPESPFSLVVQKHLLLTHYFLARLELTWLLPDTLEGEPSGTYLVYIDRSLFDGDVSGVKRMMLVRGVLNDVSERLAEVRGLFGRR